MERAAEVMVDEARKRSGRPRQLQRIVFIVRDDAASGFSSAARILVHLGLNSAHVRGGPRSAAGLVGRADPAHWCAHVARGLTGHVVALSRSRCALGGTACRVRSETSAVAAARMAQSRRWRELAIALPLALATLGALVIGFAWVAGGRYVEFGPWTVLGWHGILGWALLALLSFTCSSVGVVV